MAKFNLKKFAEEDKKVQEEQLEGVREGDSDHLFSQDALLDDKRKDKEIKKTTEDQLDKVREGKSWNNTIEKQLDTHKVSADLPKRTGEDEHDQLPINLLEEAAHQDKIKAYRKAEEKGAKDVSVPEQPKSQLHNHPDRFKGTKVKEMVTASLKDADAMLYYIYHTAASQQRELTVKEQSLVDGINKDKIRLTENLFNGIL